MCLQGHTSKEELERSLAWFVCSALTQGVPLVADVTSKHPIESSASPALTRDIAFSFALYSAFAASLSSPTSGASVCMHHMCPQTRLTSKNDIYTFAWAVNNRSTSFCLRCEVEHRSLSGYGPLQSEQARFTWWPVLSNPEI